MSPVNSFDMKILEINVYNYRKGGSEAVYFNTCDILRAHGHEVINFALQWDKNLDSPQSGYFAQSNESRRGPLRPLKNLAGYFYNRDAARQLDRLLTDEHPDIAHVHLLWGQLSPSILKVLKKHHVPVVHTAHDFRVVCPGYLFRDGKGRICEACEGHKFRHCIARRCQRGSLPGSIIMAAEQRFRNWFYNPARLISGFHFVSNFSRDKHLKYMPALKDVPNVQLYNMSTGILREPVSPATPHYFLYYGRLSGEKGVKTLVEAFAELPHCHLKVVGTGPDEESLKALTTERGLSNIEFLGYKTGDELTKIVSEAYFTIVPSECYENNPMTVIESYSAGTPVIGARIGGIPEIVPHIAGFTFESANVVDLRAAVEKAVALSAEAYNAMQQNAQQFARENFDSEHYYNTLIGFFKSLVEK